MPRLQLEDLDALSHDDLRRALVTVLRGCPNGSCTRKSLVTRVAAGHFGVTTLRGARRDNFEERLNRALGYMQNRKPPLVQIYKSTNERVRLLPR